MAQFDIMEVNKPGHTGRNRQEGGIPVSNKRLMRVELRYYEMPRGERMLPLLGEHWRRNYGNDVDAMHFHNLMEVGYCHEGNGNIETLAGDRPYTGGIFTMVPRNIPHSTRTKGLVTRDYWEYLFFDAEKILAAHCRDNPVLERQLNAALGRMLYIGTVEDNPAAAGLIRALLDYARTPAEALRHKVTDSLLYALLLEFAGLVTHVVEYQGKLTETGAIGSALGYVEEHYAEPIRIQVLAEACGLSETHFRRLFGEVLNMSPGEYINLIRIQKACELLCNSDDSMEQIAEKTGFATQSSFSRNFVKLVGVPPYRWKNSEENYGGTRQFRVTAREGWR